MLDDTRGALKIEQILRKSKKMKFTPVKSARKGSLVARTIAGAAILITPTDTESASQLDHVWNLLNMVPTDFTRKALVKDLEIDDVKGEEGYTTLERTSIRPTLDVNGIWGGYIGEGA